MIRGGKNIYKKYVYINEVEPSKRYKKKNKTRKEKFSGTFLAPHI